MKTKKQLSLGKMPTGIAGVGSSGKAGMKPTSKPLPDNPRQVAEQLAALVRQLAEVETAIQTLTGAQVDAIISPEGHALMLRQTQEALRSSEERFRQFAENIDEVFFLTGPDAKTMIYVSPAYENVWGRSCQSLYDNPLSWLEGVHSEDRGRVEDLFRNAGNFQTEYRIVRPDGAVRGIWSRTFPIKDQKGVVYRLARIAQDITERKQASKALEESEERLRMAIKAARMYTWDLDIQSGKLIRSGQQHEIYGSDLPVSNTDFASFLQMIHPEDREKLEEAVDRATKERAAFSTGFRIVRPNGDIRWLETHGQVYPDGTDKAVRMIGVTQDITERKQAEATIQHMAFYDTLTKLPNRNKLYDCLLNAIRTDSGQGKPMAVLLMDLDHFKEINDTLGHQRGDLLLKEVGVRLKSVLFEPDVVARLGGDEFAILLPKLASPDDINLVIQKIITAVGAPFMIESLPIAVEASIGVALYPDHGENPDSLMQRADVAMYRAKESGSGYLIYDAKHDQHSPRRLSLIGELREAIEKDHLFLHYQPKISLKTKRVIGVEALVRWQHPEYGFVPPDQFILPAEQTGLIHPLTRWVLKTALRQCQAWRQAGLNLPVSVNLSARNLHDPQFPDHLAELLKTTGALPEQLELEITESAIMADPQRALEVTTHLRTMGLRFALDDFGIGYSSLAYLKKLPVDSIKIDKSFVIDMARDEDDVLIVLSTINLAHNLGLKVVAEGVETEKILDQLSAFGCDEAQGYYMSKPLPVDDLNRWLKESPWGMKMA
jgi:diguanylate cyclase (GGDEF)-like protein/PAS domain S-box-containing protein